MTTARSFRLLSRLFTKPLYPRACLARNQSDSSRIEAMKERLLDPEMASTGDTGGGSNMMTMLSLQDDNLIYITKYSPYGFTLNNNVTLMGPCVFFPNSCFSWLVSGFEDIHEESLSLITLLAPKPDLLIIGTGLVRRDLDLGLVKMLREHRINFEVLTTDKAIATYNFTNNDQRWIAAALLPPEPARSDLYDKARSRLEAKLDETDLYLDDDEFERIESTSDISPEKLAQPSEATASLERIAVRSPLGHGGHLGGTEIKVVEGKKTDMKNDTHDSPPGNASGKSVKTDNQMARQTDIETNTSDSGDKQKR